MSFHAQGNHILSRMHGGERHTFSTVTLPKHNTVMCSLVEVENKLIWLWIPKKANKMRALCQSVQCYARSGWMLFCLFKWPEIFDIQAWKCILTMFGHVLFENLYVCLESIQHYDENSEFVKKFQNLWDLATFPSLMVLNHELSMTSRRGSL